MPASLRSRGQSWLSCKQSKLGAAGLVFLLCVTGISCPFSLDMYTPAMPGMPAEFNTTASVVNFTVTGFYLFFSIGMLLFGPVSDKTGRKPVLVGGVLLFSAGSFLCSLATNIWVLIAFRCIQALGAGAVCTVSTAIVKDCFVEEKRTSLLSILQIMQVVGPVLAPLLGGLILAFSTWHTTFIVLTIFGIFCLVLALNFEESLPAEERTQGSLLVPFKNMSGVFANVGFMTFLVIISFFSVAFMGYVASASYIYVDVFGESAQVYSYFFAATAGISVLGPILYLKLEKKGMTPRRFTHIILAGSVLIAFLMFLFAQLSVWIFFICMAIFALFEASVRPYATNVLLMQYEKDAGAASAVINFVANLFGVFGMLLISLWSIETYVHGLATLILGSMVIAILLWVWLLKFSKLKIKGL